MELQLGCIKFEWEWRVMGSHLDVWMPICCGFLLFSGPLRRSGFRGL